MSHLKKEIQDEKEGAEHYRKLADRADTEKDEEVFEGMANDEARHKKNLKKMESDEMAPVDVPAGFKKLIKR
jgi:rubrerythrin